MLILEIAMRRNGAKRSRCQDEMKATPNSTQLTIEFPLDLKALNSALTCGDLLVSPVASRQLSIRFVSMM
jgi:hypothetical protein